MSFKIKNVLGVIILSLGTYLTATSITQSWTEFMTSCPNKDVLSWDANLRFNKVVDLYHDLNNGKYFSPVEHTLRSPTWPSFRSNIALALFLVSDSGPDTILDIKISVFFFVLMFVAIFWVSLDLVRDFFKATIIWITVSQMILHTRQFTVFSLSSMLETQGMFFMLLTAYFLYKIYEQQRIRIFTQHNHVIENPTRFWIGLFFSAQGLFHTKYPYGLMLFIAVGLYEIIRQKERFQEFLGFILSNHYTKKRRAFFLFIMLLIVGFIGALILSQIFGLGMPSGILKSKSAKKIIWLISFITFLDLNYCTFKYRIELKSLFDKAFQQIYVVLLLPIAFWLLIHPDRVGSILGTQQHSQESSRSFIVSFFGYVFDRPEPIAIIATLALIGLLIFYSSFFIRSDFKAGVQSILNHPLSALIVIFSLQFIILEKLTGNKQLRHIYHLVPVILILLALLIIRIPKSLYHKKFSFPFITFILSRSGYLILPLVLLFYINPFAISDGSTVSFVQAVKNYNYVDRRLICFTGRNIANYKTVRSLVKKTSINKNTVLLNILHNETLVNPSRMLATEFDLLLRIKGLKNDVAVRNDNTWDYKTWESFEQAIVINLGCQKNAFDMLAHKRALKLNVRMALIHEELDKKSNLCLKTYQLSSL